MKPLFRALPLLLLTAVVTPARDAAAQAVDDREVKAREFFTIGKYQEAMELYGKLYAETLHPTYLRNVGRCYQMMGDADRAIASFRDYLRRAKDLTQEAQTEINGFIREIEDLKQKRAQEAKDAKEAADLEAQRAPAVAPAIAVPAAGPPATAPSAAPPPVSTALVAPSAASGGLVDTAHASKAEADADRDGTNWWLWGTLGVLVVGSVAAFILVPHKKFQESMPATDLGWHQGGS